MNKKIVLAISCLSFVLLLPGCASIFGDNSKTVQVNSQPQNAQVLVNNMPMGTTPLCMSVPNTWSPTLLTFRKCGYADQCAQVNTAFQPVGILNIFFWPGFIIDAAAGNMMKVSPQSRNIYAVLAKPV